MLDVGEDEVTAPGAADGAPGAADGRLPLMRWPSALDARSVATPEEAAELLERGARDKEAGNERFKAGAPPPLPPY